MNNLFEFSGEVVQIDELRITRAADFARYAARSANAAFEVIECRRFDDVLEAVCVCVRAEIPQRPVYDLRYEEPLAVVFPASSETTPEVWALRTDFPHVVPHLIRGSASSPKSLCLFDERPEELNLRWTPALLGERILMWLRDTATDTLHRDDQDLEPFIGGRIRPLILPPDVFANAGNEILHVYSASESVYGEVLVADRSPITPIGMAATQFTFLPFALPAQQHGIIRQEPSSLLELHALCQQAGVDLLDLLKKRLQEKMGLIKPDSKGTILVLAVPKVRHANGGTEVVDFYCFRCRLLHGGNMVDTGPGQIGEFLQVIGKSAIGASYMPLVTPRDQIEGRARLIGVTTLNPQPLLTGESAARMSGHSARCEKRFLAIGLGALGSQVFANLVRQAYGYWFLVDEDYYAPHNAVRHAIFGGRFGVAKAVEIAARANEMFSGPPIARALVTNVLYPGGVEAALKTEAIEADTIIDMSASVAVGRAVALDVESPVPRLSLFLSPSGNALVLMAEAKDRALPLDAIELQYLRAILRDTRLKGHLMSPGEPLRYAGSCRDVSSTISQEMVGLFAAIGAAALRGAVEDRHTSLSIWKCDKTRMSVERHDVELSPGLAIPAEGWTIVTDEGLRNTLMEYRQTRLPAETCGILLGYFDTQWRRIYICDALPAPLDTIETEDGCKRGISGLQEAVERISAETLGQVGYIGEWHSHPDGASCLPSTRDQKQLDWISERMHPEGKPGLILIICEGRVLSLYLREP